ncbi:hypothetical protein PMIN01_08007 [Paraphaeosphaeria minitans]|uniref:Uncharacterized protein n=1 Tax=Paraphaeosphaeria minitans TaxID=565426 RepID=A0A9P6GE00_9PLEO|nr:hypothetical protein PMIN01_08007 [Paraphaeosphaeria minitans]
MVWRALWTKLSARSRAVAEAGPWRGEQSAKKLCGQARLTELLTWSHNYEHSGTPDVGASAGGCRLDRKACGMPSPAAERRRGRAVVKHGGGPGEGMLRARGGRGTGEARTPSWEAQVFRREAEVLAGVGQEARAARERAVGADTSMGVAASSTTTASLGAVQCWSSPPAG